MAAFIAVSNSLDFSMISSLILLILLIQFFNPSNVPFVSGKLRLEENFYSLLRFILRDESGAEGNDIRIIMHAREPDELVWIGAHPSTRVHLAFRKHGSVEDQRPCTLHPVCAHRFAESGSADHNASALRILRNFFRYWTHKVGIII